MPFLQGLLDFGKSITPGIVGAAGSMIQSRSDAEMAKYNTDRTIEANRQLAEYQYSKDLEMWNKGNEYNSPSAQMARLKSAGLNPNMMYGSSGATQPAVNLPKYQAPRVEYGYKPSINLPAMLSMYQDFQLKNAQLDNLRADRQNKELNYQMQNNLIDNNGEVLPYYQLKQQAELNKAGYAWRVLQTQWERQRQDSWINLPKYQSDLYATQVRNMENQMMLRDKQIEWFMGDKLASYLGVGGGLLRNLGGLFRGGAKNVSRSAPSVRPSTRWNSPSRWEEALRNR